MKNVICLVIVLLLMGWATAVSTSPSETIPTTAIPIAPTITPFPPGSTIQFAIIGDYGHNSASEAAVATLVASWKPDFVIATGDSNYNDGEASTIDANIGQYYSDFIGNYKGIYGNGSPTNRFWPSLGNHDWRSLTCNIHGCTGPYFDYFTLPGNERYYELDFGSIHLFALNSDSSEPDGNDVDEPQALWLQSTLAASDACFQLVYFHHPPYSSGQHGNHDDMMWPFAAWGVDAVVSGHDHNYERMMFEGIPYYVNGSGGRNLRSFSNINNLPPGVTSVVRYNEAYGAMLVTVSDQTMVLQFFNTDQELIDEYSINHDNCSMSPTAVPIPTLES